jgi:glucosamine--fructose-6-phosphate aminotransferase (isomerizing)
MPSDVTSYRMYDQIQGQPAELARLLAASEPVEEAATLLAGASRVLTIGIGTSYNAAMAAAAMLSAAGLDARAWSSHDFAMAPPQLGGNDAAIVFSHTGRKQYSVSARTWLRQHEVPSVWVAGAEPDGDASDVRVVLTTVSRETSSAYTVSHTAAMMLVARLADAITPGAVGDIAAVPDAVAQALGSEGDVAALAAEWAGRSTIYGVGAGAHEPAAHEIAIKVNEAARMRCRGYASEQFLHGPQAQVEPAEDTVVAFAGADAASERTQTVAQFALDVGMPVAWVGATEGPARTQPLLVPDVGEQLAAIVALIPAQLLAAHLAAQRGVDADDFRLGEAAFKQAFERYDL